MQSANYIVHDTHGNIVATGIYNRSDATATVKYNARFVDAMEKGHFVTIANAEADVRRVRIVPPGGTVLGAVVVPELFRSPVPGLASCPTKRTLAQGTDLGPEAEAEHEASIAALATADAEKRQKELKRERDRRYRERMRKTREHEDA